MQSVVWKKMPDFDIHYLWNMEAPTISSAQMHPMQPYMSLIFGGKDLKTTKKAFQKVNGYVVSPLDAETHHAAEELFEKGFSGLRQFWGATDTPDTYTFAVIPFSSVVSHAFGGIALEGGFCSKYNPTLVNSGSIPDQMAFNAVHEMGHTWLGGAFSFGMDNQWFHEGFNDYVTLLTMFEHGIWDAPTTQRKWNERLDSYYKSPLHRMSNEEIWAHYWDSMEFNTLPYKRGSIFAALLDKYIRQASAGRSTIKDFMNRLLAKHRADGVKIEDFKTILQEYLPKGADASELLETHIISGVPIERKVIEELPFFKGSDLQVSPN